ncbi:MAG: hypothetical protein RL062_1475 [Bacteroidota bacterium]
MRSTPFYIQTLFTLALVSVMEVGFAQSQFMEFLTRPTTIKLQSQAIDDDRNSFSGLFTPQTWSKSYIPTKITISKTIQERLKVDWGLAYLKMNPSVYKERYLDPGVFFNTDINLRYQINFANNFFDRLYVPRGNSFLNNISNMGFNVYPVFGVGYTLRTQTIFKKSINMNFGAGLTCWFKKNRFGINMESQAKVGIDSRMPISGSNYFHHSAGIVIVTKSNNYIGRGRRNIHRTRIKF